MWSPAPTQKKRPVATVLFGRRDCLAILVGKINYNNYVIW